LGQPTNHRNPTSAYVHFPWCLKKCPYCDFASGAVRREQVAHEAYAGAILTELEARPTRDRTLVSVFFGGGTPSLWDPAALGRVLAAIRGAFDREVDDLEVTVECNPTSIDARRAAALREVGVNRLSIGVQSLDDERLRFLGRLHDADGALRAVRGVAEVMDRVSGDLMFGMPGQTADDFADEIDRLLDTGVEHVSAYSLTIEPETQFGALHRKGKLPLALEDDVADTFERAREVFAAAGFTHYEVSNYARPGAAARHNRHYWRGEDYLGLGAGAVGALDGRRYKNDPRPEGYLATPAAAEVFEERLTATERVQEALMLGLRTDEGIAFGPVERRTGLDPRRGREDVIAKRAASGDLVVRDERMIVPHARWLALDSIVADLF